MEKNLSNFNNFCLKYQKLISSSPISQKFLSEKLCLNNHDITPVLQVCVESGIEVVPAIIEVVKAKDPVLCSYIQGSKMLSLKGFIKDVYNDEGSIDSLNQILFMDDQKWFDLATINYNFNTIFGQEKYKALSNWVVDFGVPNTISLLKSNLVFAEFIKDEDLKKECAKLLYKDILFLNPDLKYENMVIKHWLKMGFDKEELKGLCKSLEGDDAFKIEEPKSYHTLNIDLVKIQRDLKKQNNFKDDFKTINGYIQEVYESFRKLPNNELGDFFIKNDSEENSSIKTTFIFMSDKIDPIRKFHDFILLAFNQKYYEKKNRTIFLDELFDKYNKSYNLNLALKRSDEESGIQPRKKI